MTRAAAERLSAIRGGAVLAGFFALTVPLMPLQALLLRVSPRGARTFPNWYHRQVCRLLGIRIHIDGAVARDRPVLLVANHTSWLDIPVLSAVAPVSFVAKKEVGHLAIRLLAGAIAALGLRRPHPAHRRRDRRRAKY